MNSSTVMNSYESYLRKKRLVIAVELILIPILILLSISLGSVTLSLREILSVLFSSASSSTNRSIILNIRLPQVLSALVTGGALALAGAVMQTILQNPLGSPYTLGISHAAAFGAALSVMFFSSSSVLVSSDHIIEILAPYRTALFAFTLSMGASAILIRISRLRTVTPQVMVLVGVTLGSLFTAGTMFLQYFADDVQLSAIVFWTFGDVGRVTWNELLFLSIISVACTIGLLSQSWKYNAIALGSETAAGLGVSIGRLRAVSMGIASLLTAVITATVGVIGFVGLAAPHMARRLTGEDHRFFLISSCLTGSILLMVSDLIARTVLMPRVLPVAIITAFIGAPLFIYLLIKGYH